LAGATVAHGAPGSDNREHEIGREAIDYYSTEITRFQRQTWHWQRVMGVALSPPPARGLTNLSAWQVKRAATLWRKRSNAAYRRAQRPPHLREFMCIHRYEGSWTDRGHPYWGGLQMDISFQQSYGGYLFQKKGTADRWSPLEQIWAAEKAHRSRGFWPWPNTARYCGLL
jgi:hypothetical protein